MMARFTKELRQRLIREFAEQNGGWYDPAAFLAHIRKEGAGHPAYAWFEWDDGKAAHEYRLDQARDFARGLVVTFEVRTVHRGSFKIVEQTAPLILSPTDGRRSGGGYFVTDPNDPAHMDELCRQAAAAFKAFLHRYGAALAHAGINVGTMEKAAASLEHVVEHKEAA